jgi:hypothetical protein
MPKINARELEQELLLEFGGNPLEGSGFENEEPEADFDAEAYELGRE